LDIIVALCAPKTTKLEPPTQQNLLKVVTGTVGKGSNIQTANRLFNAKKAGKSDEERKAASDKAKKMLLLKCVSSVIRFSW
jgi:hypothetical protein